MSGRTVPPAAAGAAARTAAHPHGIVSPHGLVSPHGIDARSPEPNTPDRSSHPRRDARRERPALLAVAHGSRDPRHAEALRALVAAVRTASPGLEVELGFLDLCGPDVPSALATLEARGVRHATAVPLFLTSGYHVRHDIPAALAAASRPLRRPPRVALAPALGPDPLLIEALERRVREAGLWPGDPDTAVVLASAGSSDPGARTQVEHVARRWERIGWGSVECAYASTAAPAVGDAVRALRIRGRRNIAVVSYFLAPGRLPDRVRATAEADGARAKPGSLVVTEPLTSVDHPPAAELVRLLLSRHAAGADRPGPAVSAA
jgi:sirohydrochlorin ferrochelatase